MIVPFKQKNKDWKIGKCIICNKKTWISHAPNWWHNHYCSNCLENKFEEDNKI